MEIKQHDNKVKGAFYIEIVGVKVAEMTYSHANPNKIILEHTEVSETLKGQGVGYKLIDAAVAYLRANNLKVTPSCSFADSVFKKKHDQYTDVLA